MSIQDEPSPPQNGHTGVALLDAELQRVLTHKSHVEKNASWQTLAALYPSKLDQIIREKYCTDPSHEIPDPFGLQKTETVQSFRDRLVAAFTSKFTDAPPFTILRLAEILLDPLRYSSTVDKFLRSLENVTCVSSKTTDFGGDKGSFDDNNHVNGSSEKVVPVTVGDEEQTILLTKIDWLTEDDLKAIEDEGYLVGLTTPLEEVAEGNGDTAEEQHADSADSLETENGNSSEIKEEDMRKRKAEKEGDPVPESPEKRPKTRHGDMLTEESSDAHTVTETGTQKESATLRTEPTHDDTLPEDRIDDSLIAGEKDPADESVNGDDEKLSNQSVVMQDADADEGVEDTTVGDETLPEDKMDID